MEKNFDNEATDYDAKKAAPQQQTPPQFPGKTDEKKGSAKVDLKSAAVGAGSAVLVGGIAAMFMGAAPANAEEATGTEHPEWVDDDIKVAEGVNDDMSFNEAFAAARAEVGPGGCFEWHGQVYGTYYADEWAQMSAAEKAEFGSHFSWNHLDSGNSDVAAHTPHAEASAATQPADEVEVVTVDSHGLNPNDQNVHEPEVIDINDVEPEDPEVVVLGAVHDSDTGANIGGLVIDGQEVMVIDLDGDETFDVMMSDLNHDGRIDDSEVFDISADHLTVNDVGGFVDGTDDLTDGHLSSDYINDAPMDA